MWVRSRSERAGVNPHARNMLRGPYIYVESDRSLPAVRFLVNGQSAHRDPGKRHTRTMKDGKYCIPRKAISGLILAGIKIDLRATEHDGGKKQESER